MINVNPKDDNQKKVFVQPELHMYSLNPEQKPKRRPESDSPRGYDMPAAEPIYASKSDLSSSIDTMKSALLDELAQCKTENEKNEKVIRVMYEYVGKLGPRFNSLQNELHNLQTKSYQQADQYELGTRSNSLQNVLQNMHQKAYQHQQADQQYEHQEYGNF